MYRPKNAQSGSRSRWLVWLGTLAIALALVTQSGHMGTFGVVLLVMVAVAYLGPRLSLMGLRVSIEPVRNRVMEEETFILRVQVRNVLPIPVWGVWLEFEDGLGVLGHADSRVALDAIAPFERKSVGISLTAPRRGVYPTKPSRLCSGFPFGLSVRCGEIECLGKVTVWPKVFDTVRPPILGRSSDMHNQATGMRSGFDGDFSGIREYRLGEPSGRIHWPQTARRGKLIVHEREELQSFSATIELDLSCEWFGSNGDSVDFDWAVRALASFVKSYTNDGHQVRVVLGERERMTVASGADMPRLLDRLATLEPTGGVVTTASASDSGMLITHANSRTVRDSGSKRLRVVFGDPAGRQDLQPRDVWRWVDTPDKTPDLLGADARRGIHEN